MKLIVTLFTKEICSLCKPVKFIINKVKLKQNFVYKEVDIEAAGNEKWFDLYKHDIPVVHINGKEFVRHTIDEPKFFKALKDELKL